MCLITTQKQVKIAEEDIICYKTVNIHNNIICSVFNTFVWTLGKLVKTEITEIFSGHGYLTCFDSIDSNTNSINGKLPHQLLDNEIRELGIRCFEQGFHSAKTKERIEYRLQIYDDEELMEKLAECIIPKGSEYYENNNDLMISNQLIMVKIL